MVEKWVIIITMVNKDGEFDHFINEHDSIFYATRDILTYKKRGYEIIKYELEKELRLF